MENQCSTSNPCAAVQLLVQKTNDHDKAIEKLDETVERIQDRLPPWVTGAAAVASAVGGVLIGALATLASK